MPERTFLGKGWSFPPTFIKEKKPDGTERGYVKMVADEADVEQSLNILLSSRPGERPLQPTFGINLDVMLFEPLTTTLITFVEDLIQTAVILHEPRIELNSVEIETGQANQGVVLISLDYTLRSDNSRYNLVYPFYLEEGTDINITLKEGIGLRVGQIAI